MDLEGIFRFQVLQNQLWGRFGSSGKDVTTVVVALANSGTSVVFKDLTGDNFYQCILKAKSTDNTWYIIEIGGWNLWVKYEPLRSCVIYFDYYSGYFWCGCLEITDLIWVDHSNRISPILSHLFCLTCYLFFFGQTHPRFLVPKWWKLLMVFIWGCTFSKRIFRKGTTWNYGIQNPTRKNRTFHKQVSHHGFLFQSISLCWLFAWRWWRPWTFMWKLWSVKSLVI